MAIFITWNVGTLLGALAGGGLGDPRDYGLDAIFPAIFLALLVPQVRDRAALGAALLGAAIALVLLPLTPAGVPVMAAVLGCVPFLLLRRARAMSWWSVLALCAAAYGLKAAGVLLAGRVGDGRQTRASLELVVVPVLAALVVVQTLDGGRAIAIDARLPALLVGAFLIWRRAPLLVVALAAGATAALLRAAA